MIVRFTPRALTDLHNIAAYIELDNPAAAKAVVDRIRRAIGYLQMFPLMGHQSYLSDTLEIVVPHLPFMVVYMVDDTAVSIITVFHTARDRDNYLDSID